MPLGAGVQDRYQCRRQRAQHAVRRDDDRVAEVEVAGLVKTTDDPVHFLAAWRGQPDFLAELLILLVEQHVEHRCGGIVAIADFQEIVTHITGHRGQGILSDLVVDGQRVAVQFVVAEIAAIGRSRIVLCRVADRARKTKHA